MVEAMRERRIAHRAKPGPDFRNRSSSEPPSAASIQKRLALRNGKVDHFLGLDPKSLERRSALYGFQERVDERARRVKLPRAPQIFTSWAS
jgi:hypothetical protein